MESKYREGDTVYAIVKPERKLTVERFVNNVYYCKVQDDQAQKALVYFERELISEQQHNRHR